MLDAVVFAPTKMPRDVARLPNLGPKSAAVLAQVGVRTLADLRRIGAVPAYLRAEAAAPGVSLNLLYALVGALDGCDWREVKRTRRLELLMQLESAGPPRPPRDELLALRNVGPASRRDLALLGISNVAQLARQNPDRLYATLQAITGQRHDPCVWDTFAAAIHQAKTGEALPWWHFTAIRKNRGQTPISHAPRRPPV
ncbi:MAG: helix-hairpin-helix domain-containing protein [Betaproteobacteria bacterium]